MYQAPPPYQSTNQQPYQYFIPPPQAPPNYHDHDSTDVFVQQQPMYEQTPIFNQDDFIEHYQISDCRLYSSMGCSISGIILFWPLCIISAFLIRKDYVYVTESEVYTKKAGLVRFAWWISFIGIIWGMLETLIIMICVFALHQDIRV